MPAVRSASSTISPSPSRSTTPATAFNLYLSTNDITSTSEDTIGEAPYTRRRASEEQLKILREIFEAKPYPTREERNTLALEVGMDYKAITVWFQNKRQSEKRKAWTKNARAKKRALARQEALVATVEDPPSLKSGISLDRIASMAERSPSSSHQSFTLPLTSRPPLTPRRGTSRRVSPSTPIPRSELWMHMPSSPPDAPPSPAVEKIRLSLLPPKSKAAKSLEWACANARADRRNARGKENRAPKIILSPSARRGYAETEVDDSETETEPDEAVTPSRSLASIDGFGVSMKTEPAEDVEAAMLLLGFLKGQ
ncbi:hypothetical protein FA95DRAFT_1561344 [Auriscalpium vulgare]|uniref:Uncharacterized protein n=1 Tax=Auriscalpium vulgare TaxID=40419 RepID=A0ACB8RMT2_9AGAM|nr:hypothetical protein FA95DRAFT_1561344 [Auriscalpium vulgare]